jgi:hypothetical protein
LAKPHHRVPIKELLKSDRQTAKGTLRYKKQIRTGIIMNKNAKLLGAVALSLGTIFSSGCSTMGPRSADNDNPPTSDLNGLARIFNSVASIPVTMVDSTFAKKLITMAQRDQISPTIILSHKIELETGVQPNPESMQAMGMLIVKNSPAALRRPEPGPDGEMGPEKLCLVYADLPGDAEKGTIHAMVKIDKESLSDTIPALLADKIDIPADLAERMIKLHEGFHCADRYYVPPRLEIQSQIQKSTGNYAEDGALRLEIDALTNRAETFADVAMILKMAQEGHRDVIAPHAAIRSIAQAHSFVSHVTNPGFAASTLAQASGFQASPATGWPDNLTYVSVPGLAHNTVKGVLAAQEFVNSKWDWQLRAMSMEDIMKKAHEITEETTMSADQLRGLSYTMWAAPREIIGETQAPLAEKLCPPPCATAITKEQRELGKAAIADYKKTIDRALIPFIKAP